MSANRLRLVLADDSVLFRDGVAGLLTQRGFAVVATAGDGDQAVAQVLAHQPDVAVLDLRMPPSGAVEGLEAAARIGAESPSVAILVLSDYLEPAYARRLLADGNAGRGYLLKETVIDVDALAEAIQRVAHGECVVDAAIVQRLLARRRDGGPLAALTEREHEILAMMAEGLTNAGIAARLVLSERTIEGHIRRMMRKLRVPEGLDDHRRVLAVLTYLRV